MHITCRLNRVRSFSMAPGPEIARLVKEDRFGVTFVVTRTNLFSADCWEGFTDVRERDFSIR